MMKILRLLALSNSGDPLLLHEKRKSEFLKLKLTMSTFSIKILNCPHLSKNVEERLSVLWSSCAR